MKTFVFAMNYNPIIKSEEPYLTEFKIPAESWDEATQKLKSLVGNVVAKKCFFNDEYDH